jgi:hypothetical protein
LPDDFDIKEAAAFFSNAVPSVKACLTRHALSVAGQLSQDLAGRRETNPPTLNPEA